MSFATDLITGTMDNFFANLRIKWKRLFVEEYLMDWDDEYDNGYDDTGHGSHQDNSMSDKGNSEGDLDFKDITKPVSVYFFLSDDAQDEITGKKEHEVRVVRPQIRWRILRQLPKVLQP